VSVRRRVSEADGAAAFAQVRQVFTSALSDENIRKKWPYYVIDGFIVSPNISIMSVETLDESFRYADHNPVKLRVTLNP